MVELEMIASLHLVEPQLRSLHPVTVKAAPLQGPAWGSLASPLPQCNMAAGSLYRDVQIGDIVTVGECRPLSKTVRFNVLKVTKAAGTKKQFQKF